MIPSCIPPLLVDPPSQSRVPSATVLTLVRQELFPPSPMLTVARLRQPDGPGVKVLEPGESTISFQGRSQSGWQQRRSATVIRGGGGVPSSDQLLAGEPH